jgi:hypothetical protein
MIKRSRIPNTGHNTAFLCVGGSSSTAVLRIRDLYPESLIMTFFHPGSRIPDPTRTKKSRGEIFIWPSFFVVLRIRDPGLGAFLTPGSGIRDGRKSGFGIRDEQPGSYFLELRNHFLLFLGLKYINSLIAI